jgi:hypothetical protein
MGPAALKSGRHGVDIGLVAVPIVHARSGTVTVGHDERPRPARRRQHGVLLLVLAAVLFLAYGWRMVAAPFGDSHDGRNAAVWAAGSQAIRHEGLVASRLGTRNPESGVYANHPPLIYLETAAAEAIGPHSTGSTRAPAWIGSLVLLVLLYRLLRDRGIRSAAAGLAILLTVATPMFLIYGTMLDTPVTSLPIAVGLLLVWERARRGHKLHPVAAGALAAVAVLSGWQAMLVALAIGGWAAVRLLRRASERPRADAGFVLGAITGVGLLVAWLLWAFGGTLRPLLDQFRVRTGPKVGLSDLLAAQRTDIASMFGLIAVVAVAGLVVALRSERTRGLAAVALAVTLPYPVLFRSGAVNHNYWDYWFLLPIAVGLAAGGERVLAWWEGRRRPQSAVVLAVAALALMVTLVSWSRPRAAEVIRTEGFAAGRAAGRVVLDPSQPRAWYAGAVGEPASWLALATGRPATAVHPSEYAAVAASVPDQRVFLGEVRCVGGRDVRTFDVRPAASLADQPPVIAPCR